MSVTDYDFIHNSKVHALCDVLLEPRMTISKTVMHGMTQTDGDLSECVTNSSDISWMDTQLKRNFIEDDCEPLTHL